MHTYIHTLITYVPTYIHTLITYVHTYIPLHYITLHYITLHYITYITLHYITFNYITFNYITFNYIHTYIPKKSTLHTLQTVYTLHSLHTLHTTLHTLHTLYTLIYYILRRTPIDGANFKPNLPTFLGGRFRSSRKRRDAPKQWMCSTSFTLLLGMPCVQ